MHRFLLGVAVALIALTGIAAYTYTYNYDVLFARRALAVGTTTSNAKFSVVNDTVAQDCVQVKAAGSQTADLIELQNSSGTALFTVDVNGMIRMPNSVAVLTTASALVNGTAGTGAGYAGKGSLALRSTGDAASDTVMYINGGTAASPSWVAIDTSP